MLKEVFQTKELGPREIWNIKNKRRAEEIREIPRKYDRFFSLEFFKMFAESKGPNANRTSI